MKTEEQLVTAENLGSFTTRVNDELKKGWKAKTTPTLFLSHNTSHGSTHGIYMIVLEKDIVTTLPGKTS